MYTIRMGSVAHDGADEDRAVMWRWMKPRQRAKTALSRESACMQQLRARARFQKSAASGAGRAGLAPGVDRGRYMYSIPGQGGPVAAALVLPL